jgi:L-iditol 2-dehydrogenase
MWPPKPGNLSAVLYEKGDLRLEHREVPSIGAHQLLIRVHTVGICGTDVHYWTKGRVGQTVVSSPFVLGHEPSGTVEEVGADAAERFGKGIFHSFLIKSYLYFHNHFISVTLIIAHF